MHEIAKPKFELGTVLITPGAKDEFTKEEVVNCLQRHISCDWGDLCDEDRELNDADLNDGGRLLSAYKFGENRTLWIITEADRSATTMLLPSEY